MGFIKFIHHLFDPHCQLCEVDKQCKNCDTLRQLLETEKWEKKQILEKLIGKTEVEPTRELPKDFKPLGKQHVSWAVKRAMLEQADRESAHAKAAVESQIPGKILKEVPISDLEKELGVDEQNG